MRFFITIMAVFLNLLALAGTAQATSATDKQVFNEMLEKGVPVAQAVYGVLANSPSSAPVIVESALAKKADKVFSITLFALRAAPKQYDSIMNTVIHSHDNDSQAIIKAVVDYDVNKLTDTVKKLTAKNNAKQNIYIGQAADALVHMQVTNKPQLGQSPLRQAL